MRQDHCFDLCLIISQSTRRWELSLKFFRSFLSTWSLQLDTGADSPVSVFVNDQATRDSLVDISGLTEVCARGEYDGPQYFCVDTTLGPADAGPVFLIDPNVGRVPQGLTMVYQCFSEDGFFGLTTSPDCTRSADGGLLARNFTSFPLGYASTLRLQQMPLPVVVCTYDPFNEGFTVEIGAGATCHSVTFLFEVISWFAIEVAREPLTDLPGRLRSFTSLTAVASVDDNTLDDCRIGAGDPWVFTCKDSGNCITLNQLCDGIVDCPVNGEDEDQYLCFTWTALYEDALLASSSTAIALVVDSATSSSQLTLLDCVRQAMTIGSRMIAFASNNSVCLVYGIADSFSVAQSESVAQAEQVLTRPAPGMTLFANVDGNNRQTGIYSEPELLVCTNLHACNGHGIVQADCSCACDDGYYGSNCDILKDISSSILMLGINMSIVASPNSGYSPEDILLGIVHFAPAIFSRRWQSFVVYEPNLYVSLDVEFVICIEDNALFVALRPHSSSPNALALLHLMFGNDNELQGFFKQCEADNIAIIPNMTNSTAVSELLPGGSLAASAPIALTTHACSAAGSHLDCSINTNESAAALILSLSHDAAGPVHFPVFARTLHGEVLQLNCSSFQANFRSSLHSPCYLSECYIPFATPIVLRAVNATFSQAQVNTLCSLNWQVKVMPSFAVANIQSAKLVETVDSYIGVIAAAVVVLAASAGAMICSLVARAYDSDDDAAAPTGDSVSAANENHESTPTRLQELKNTVAASKHAQTGRWRRLRSSVLFVVSVIASIIGTVLVVVFVTSYKYRNSNAASFEFFFVSGAVTSKFASTPVSAFAVGSSDGQLCLQRAVLGDATSPIFVSATCVLNATSGGTMIAMRYGTSEAECLSKQHSFIPTEVLGQHVDSSTTLSVFGVAAIYSVARCGAEDSINQRLRDYIAGSSSNTAASSSSSVMTQTLSIPPSRQQPLHAAGESYRFNRAHIKSMDSVTSTSPSRFETFATAADSIDGIVSGVIVSTVSMSRKSLTDLPTSNFSVLVSDYLINTMDTISNQTASAAAAGPRDGDIPFGFIYSTSLNVPLPGPLAGPEASKYFGLRKTIADPGQFFGPQQSVSDGDGVTVTMYLLATTRSYGFVFALTDGLEDQVQSVSPLLEKAFKMIASGSTDGWYALGLNIYLALLIDGPGRKMKLVMANSPVAANGARQSSVSPSNAFVVEVWDLSALALERLFNGRWHVVSVLLRAENGLVRAQLVVDGETSSRSKAWNLCIPRRPLPIADLSSLSTFQVSSPFYRLSHDGLLYAGYFNGGISKLQFSPTARDVFDLWLEAPVVVRDFNSLNTTPLIALGAVLIAIGVALLAIAAKGYLSDIRDGQREQDDAAKLAASSAYEQLWASNPVDQAGNSYSFLSFATASQLLQVDNDELVLVFEDLVSLTASPQREVVRWLYTTAARLVLQPNSAGGQQLDASDRPPMVVRDGPEVVRDEDSAHPAVVLPERIVVPAEGILCSLPTQDEWSRIITEWIQVHHISSSSQEAEIFAGDQRASIAQLNGKGALPAARLAENNYSQNKTVGAHHGQKNTSCDPPRVVGLVVPLVQGILTVLQSVYVWMSTMNLPLAYHASFASFFSFISLDWTAAFSNLPPLVTPLLQLCAGILSLSALIILLVEDEGAFVKYIGAFVVRRDSLFELRSVSKVEQEVAVHDGGDAERPPPTLVVFPLAASQKIDEFLELPTDSSKSESLLHIEDGNGTAFIATFNGSEVCIRPEKGEAEGDDQTASAEKIRMERASCNCIVHTSRGLSSELVTDVWPLEHRATCCIAVGEKRCGNSTGMMYVCRHSDDCGRRCMYAMCEKHFRSKAVEKMLANFRAFYRALLGENAILVIASFALLATTAVYGPSIKTALMIISCHPYFQCLFPQCWETRPLEQSFAVAATLCIALVACLGLGLPFMLAVLLRRRLGHLECIFFSREYDNMYGTNLSHVDLREWQRCSDTDPTALGAWCKMYKPRWMYLPPIMCLWRVVLIVPAVFLQSGSLQQLVAVSVVEFVYGLFLFVTRPALVPIVNAAYKIGVAHQMLLLGLLCLDTCLRYEGSGNLSREMLAVTATYLALCGGAILWFQIYPIVQNKWKLQKVGRLLSTMGLRHTQATTLYLVPQPPA